jgi:hypothetical protein
MKMKMKMKMKINFRMNSWYLLAGKAEVVGGAA